MMNLLHKSAWITNWYAVNGFQFGQPEGTGEEWRAIVNALLADEEPPRFRRVSAKRTIVGVEFQSPRNAIDEHDHSYVSNEDLPEWLAKADALLKEDGK